MYRTITVRYSIKTSTNPENPYPPNSGGEDFTPQIWGVSARKHCKNGIFWRFTPQIRGVKISPPKFGEWAPENTVKMVVFEDSPLKFGGWKPIPPPKIGGGMGFQGKSFAIRSLQVSRDMKSTAAGPSSRNPRFWVASTLIFSILVFFFVLCWFPCFLVNLFLANLVRISGFSSLFTAIALSGKSAESTAIARKRKENPEILTKFRIFVPNFAPNFSRSFLRIFRGVFVLRFVGDGDQKKNSPKIPAIFQWKIPRQFRRKNPQKFSGERAKYPDLLDPCFFFVLLISLFFLISKENGIFSGSRTAPTKRLFKENAPFILFFWMGLFARTLFSRTLLSWPILCHSGQILHSKVLDHPVWSNASGFRFWGPLARTYFCLVPCGLPMFLSFLSAFSPFFPRDLTDSEEGKPVPWSSRSLFFSADLLVFPHL